MRSASTAATVVINVKGDYTLKVSGNLTIEAGGTLALKSAKAQFSAKQGIGNFLVGKPFRFRANGTDSEGYDGRHQG